MTPDRTTVTAADPESEEGTESETGTESEGRTESEAKPGCESGSENESRSERNTHAGTEATAGTETDAGTERTADSGRSATVAELTLPVTDFALGETAEALDGAAFEIERVVAYAGDRLVPFVWANGAERGALERAFANDSSVAAFELLADVGDGSDGRDGRSRTDRENGKRGKDSNDGKNGNDGNDGEDAEYLYRIEWTERIRALSHLLVEEGGTVLAAATANGRWNVRVLVPERPALARTFEACEAAGLSMDVAKVYTLDDGRQGRFGLTDGQQETLALAFERGYYGVPRGVMAKELADELAISHQALSERVRRAHGNLVENAIVLGYGIGRERGSL
jgi:predicted DNA binding protein